MCVWGGAAPSSPKCLLGTLQSILVTGNLASSILETVSQQTHVFPSPRIAQNIAQAESGARFGILGPSWDSGSPKWSLGPNTKKMRAGKPCRTLPPEIEMEPYGLRYGRIVGVWSLIHILSLIHSQKKTDE